MEAILTTSDVCSQLGIAETRLRHVLRRPGAPRPAIHPTAFVFLWTAEDVRRLRDFLEVVSSRRAAPRGDTR